MKILCSVLGCDEEALDTTRAGIQTEPPAHTPIIPICNTHGIVFWKHWEIREEFREKF